MKIDVNINLASLPSTVVNAAIAATGARTPRQLVLAALKQVAKSGKAERESEPLSPAQCKASRKAAKLAGVRWKITPAMRSLGIDEQFLSS
jgi:predicted Zn-ribbon and HTH transcriptional regulator